MQTGKSNIRNIFDGSSVFNIPIYQRAYSWEKEKQLKEFLNDIIGQHSERKYFLGTFLFHLQGFEGDFQLVDVIDGQQRLTTFVIFMKSLIDLMLEKGATKVSPRTKRIFIKDGDVYKLKLSNEDSSFLHQYILDDHSVHSNNIATPSQRLLVEAKNYFKSSLMKLDVAVLEKVYDTAVNSEVLLYVVDEIQSATQIFELLNDRGKKLTDLESIKSFLMYNIGLVSTNPTQLIEDIQQNFAQIYRMIERNELNDDDVLRYHTIAFEYENEKSAKEYIKNKINALIKSNRNDEAKDVIINYARDLTRSFSLFSSIYKNEDKIPELDDLYMIGRVGPFYPFLMAAKQKGNQEFIDLTKALVKFNFRAIFANLRSNAGESYIVTAHKKNEDVISLVENFCRHNWWNINVRAKNALDSVNYYDWINKNLVKYILFKYENSLRLKKGFAPLDRNDYFNDNSREKISVEHITAQRVRGIALSNYFYDNCMHNIGNLVIDTVASNSSKGNAITSKKVASYNAAPLMSQNEIDSFKCDWKDVDSIIAFVEQRNKIIKDFIVKEFEIA